MHFSQGWYVWDSWKVFSFKLCNVTLASTCNEDPGISYFIKENVGFSWTLFFPRDTHFPPYSCPKACPKAKLVCTC